MDSDTPLGPAKSLGEIDDEIRETVADSSGYVTTKQAARALGVSRRTVQSYVRRGELEAEVEGEGVEKTYYVSIDSLNDLRERRRLSGESSPSYAGASPSDSSEMSPTANADERTALFEIVQDLQYRLGRAEARAELQSVAESTLREQLERERERAERLEVELREALKRPPEPPGGPESGPDISPGVDPRGDDAGREEASERRSWWRRWFGGGS